MPSQTTIILKNQTSLVFLFNFQPINLSIINNYNSRGSNRPPGHAQAQTRSLRVVLPARRSDCLRHRQHGLLGPGVWPVLRAET